MSRWDVAAYGPDRNLIASTVVDADGELAESLHVPAGGYLCVRTGVSMGWPSTPVRMEQPLTIERLKSTAGLPPETGV